MRSAGRAESNALLYGKGIFTTIAIFDGRAFLWEKHWRRLSENAVKLGIDLSDHDEHSLADALAVSIRQNNVIDGRARITFADESPSGIWSSDSERKTSLSIITAGRRQIPKNFKLTVSPHRINTTSPLAGIKSCNYVEQRLAVDEAKRRGFDEAIRMNERGEIASACMANVFWFKGGKPFTPSLKTGCLAGTTREFVLENLECEEVEAGIEAIKDADSFFLTSAGIGVVQVAEFDGRAMRPTSHPVTSLLPEKN